MNKLLTILVFFAISAATLFSDSEESVEPVSELDFQIISDNGAVLRLLEDIDSALIKINLTFDGIYENTSNPALDVFLYSNDDIDLELYRRWKKIYFIALKNNEYRLNRGVRVGDDEELLFTKFQKGQLYEMKDKGWYLRYSSNDPEKLYTYPVFIEFEIKNDIIEKIILLYFYH